MYNRLSQSGPDADVEIIPSPARRSSSRRRSKGAAGKVGAVPLMADVQEDDYNDPPPLSAIRTYRESRNKKQGPKRKPPPTLDSPLLFTSFGEIPSPLSSPEARNDIRWSLGAPALLTPPLASPSTQSMQADSFLDRAFAASVEPGSSVDMLAAPSSSQSHHTHVKLGAVPAVATSVKPQPETPVVVDPSMASPSNQTAGPPTSAPPAPSSMPIAPPPATTSASPRPRRTPRPPSLSVSPEHAAEEARGRRRSHRRDSAQYYPQPSNFSPVPLSPLTLSPLRQAPQSPRLQRATAAYSRGARRNSATQSPTQHTAPYASVNRYTPTRDRIVLPAPLAPRAPGGSASPSREILSSSPSSPPPHDPRRWSNAAYTSPHSNVPR